MLTKTTQKRLGTLIAFMSSLPKSANKHFDMDAWFRHRGNDGHAHRLAKDGTIVPESLKGCGTTACAAGWAATIPSFRRAGFTYDPSAGFSVSPETFFDMSWRVAEELFQNYTIRTPKAWAAHARKVVSKYSKKPALYDAGRFEA